MKSHQPSDSSLFLDDELKRRVHELSQSSGLSPVELIREALEEFAGRRNGDAEPADSGLLWDIAAEITATVPEPEWDRLPSDLAKDFDHHHYGHSRVD